MEAAKMKGISNNKSGKPFVCEKRRQILFTSWRGITMTSLSATTSTSSQFLFFFFLLIQLVLKSTLDSAVGRTDRDGRAVVHCVKDAFFFFFFLVVAGGLAKAPSVYLFICFISQLLFYFYFSVCCFQTLV